MKLGKHYIKGCQSTMQSKPQLFCFTYAGGSASFFNVIEVDLSGMELVKLEYSGHGDRHSEPVYQDYDQLADDMFLKMKQKYIGGTYGLFGYSMGSITAVEVLRRILAENLPCPLHVFLASHEPFTKSEPLGLSSDALDEWVKERTIRFGALPEKLISNRPFWRMYLPLYRADYTIIGKYAFEKLDLRTEISTTIFYSESDTPFEDMMLWKQYFIGELEFVRLEGNHFFMKEHHYEMAEIIASKMGVV
jgi:surfactin synthase thioesterase subunit